MRKMTNLIVTSVSILITCLAQGQNFDVAINNCPDFQYQQYAVFPYIEAAILLQNIGRESALPILQECCEDGENQNKIIILCRMLYENEDEMRRPLIGATTFPGNSTYTDWASEPIELVQNIPFLLVRGYCLGGCPESALNYLEYCELNCTWRDEIYSMPSDDKLLSALDELLNSEKWQRPLTDTEKEFFSSQIDI